MAERIVDDIDDLVRKIRFEGWQATKGGKCELPTPSPAAISKATSSLPMASTK